jgi:hypothetical protein
MSSDVERLPEEVRASLDAYRSERSPENWTSLSQLWVRDITVFDALKLLKPDFPNSLPVPVDGLIEENSAFFEWPVLPEPDDVAHAVREVLSE